LTGYDEHPKTPRFHVLYELFPCCAISAAALWRASRPSKARFQCEVPAICGKVPIGLSAKPSTCWELNLRNTPILRSPSFAEDFKGFPLQKDFIVDYRQQFPVRPTDPITGEFFCYECGGTLSDGLSILA